ncbi:MAG: hypothetical protein K6E94_06085 [Elusimicrobiaceae bacterium]|nr:hypothetical protein [Elusimicrobiaceae bacterium]
MASITLDLFELKNLCMDMAELGVSNYIKQQEPAKDLLSQREAYRLFQESRVKEWRSRGLVKPIRMGASERSKLQYSRAELLAIDKSERLNLYINK